MKAAELLVNAMEARGARNKEVAAILGAKNSTFSKHITQNCLKAQELVDAAEYLGYKVILVDADDDTVSEAKIKSSGPRLRKQIGGVVYDTAKAEVLCRTEKADGWWLELYQTDGKEYFVAHFTDWSGVDSFLTLCPAEEAEKLLALNRE